MTIAFLPSHVRLTVGVMPFQATFDHLEAEVTAAVIVKALAMNGDSWRIIKCQELAEVFDTLTRSDGFWRKLFNNPFVRVSLHDLTNRGFAEWREDGTAVEFTDKALERMGKWVPT